MPTTSNFGWTTPADTDLVKDGAAAIRTLGNGIDASFLDLKGGTTGQVLSKASNTDLDFTWIAADPLTILDAKGDLISATAADTPARLAVGANGTVLTADSTTSTGLKWATPGGGANWSLLNAGGTSLTGAQTVTISGISGKDQILVLLDQASSASGASSISVRINGDTASNYYRYGASVANAGVGQRAGAGSSIEIGLMSSNAASRVSGYALITGANASGVKQFTSAGCASTDGSSDMQGYILGGYYDSSSTISSISIFSATGNLDSGTVFVYTTA